MKLYTIIAAIFYLLMGYTANYFLFKFSTMPFIGFMLLGLVIIAVVGTILGKANKKRKGVEGEPDAFIFPDKTAKKLKKMSLGIQYEASVISSALLMLGIVIFLIYFVFFTSSPWMTKGLIIFNSVCGLGLMGGMLVTYYQQLVSYRESTKFLNTFAASKNNRIQPTHPTQPPMEQEETYTDEIPEFANDASYEEYDDNFPYDDGNDYPQHQHSYNPAKAENTQRRNIR